MTTNVENAKCDEHDEHDGCDGASDSWSQAVEWGEAAVVSVPCASYFVLLALHKR